MAMLKIARLFSVAFATLLLVGGAQADDSFSPAEQMLFLSDHLSNVPKAMQIRYAYSKTGTLDPVSDGAVNLSVTAMPQGPGRHTHVDFLSGARKFDLPDIDDATANPVILFFLEREVREMHRLTGGSINYYRKRIRMALAEGAQVEAVTRDLGPRRVAATEIRIAPYRNDPARSRYEKFAEKTYVFTLSDDVPGKVVELRSELSTAGDAAGKGREIVISETLRFARQR